MIDQHVGQAAEHDDHHHQHHDQPQHGEGDHLEDAVVLRVAVLGEDCNLKYGKIKQIVSQSISGYKPSREIFVKNSKLYKHEIPMNLKILNIYVFLTFNFL